MRRRDSLLHEAHERNVGQGGGHAGSRQQQRDEEPGMSQSQRRSKRAEDDPGSCAGQREICNAPARDEQRSYHLGATAYAQ